MRFMERFISSATVAVLIWEVYAHVIPLHAKLACACQLVQSECLGAFSLHLLHIPNRACYSLPDRLSPEDMDRHM